MYLPVTEKSTNFSVIINRHTAHSKVVFTIHVAIAGLGFLSFIYLSNDTRNRLSKVLTYSSQNPSYFAEPSVPPCHAIILRSGFSGRCSLFRAHCDFPAMLAKAIKEPVFTDVSLRPPNNS